MTERSYLELAAHLLGTLAGTLWDYREGCDGISFRTPDGFRHRYSFKELESRPQRARSTHPPEIHREGFTCLLTSLR